MRPAIEEHYMSSTSGLMTFITPKGMAGARGAIISFKKGFSSGKKILNSLVYFRIFSRKGPKPYAEISGGVFYGTTCFVWNLGRIFSEKYFPISSECMRSAYTFAGTAEYW